MKTKGLLECYNQAYVYSVIQILNSLSSSPDLSNISASRFHVWYTRHCSLNPSHTVVTWDLYPPPHMLQKYNLVVGKKDKGQNSVL